MMIEDKPLRDEDVGAGLEELDLLVLKANYFVDENVSLAERLGTV